MDYSNKEDFLSIDPSLFDVVDQDHPEKLPSPDEIFASQIILKEKALAKLEKLGLTEDEAKAVIGI
jgi:hypothetical protein